ncbi:MAG: pentapeptide repeat-containing protein [Gammaproteobacteria bacterium]|nr:pentapeptide repeat-containing protein [Gammaproteobacteria bacterium]
MASDKPHYSYSTTRMKIWFNDKEKSFLFYLFLVLFTTFVAVMVSEDTEIVIGQLLGLSGQKNEVLTFLGLSMGGVLLVMQTIIANTRAEAMEKAALEQAKANENTEKGQRQERLKNAIEHLGHNSVSIRMGGAYELFHLAQDTKELRQTVLDILCAHIRQTTSDENYQDEHESKPSEEIQSLLNLLFVQQHEIFKDCHINLQGSWLNGVNLRRARLEKAVLIKAHLHEVSFFEADLREADLEGVSLLGANLVGANLHKADFEEAGLYQVVLINARLQGANLYKARLQGACLSGTQLQGAEFFDSRLHGANLCGAHLQGANLGKAQLQGAELLGAQLQGVTSQSDGSSSFETRIRDSIEEQSDLSGMTFEGGIKAEDLDSIVEGLPDDAAKELRTKLKPHVGKPASHELPHNSGAKTGSYTQEKAEEWIAEYKKAVPEVSEEADI